MNLLVLGSIILSVATAGAAFNNQSPLAINNEANTYKTTLGPGIINENHEDAKDPETRKNINNNRNVSFRGDNWLMLNPHDCSYMNIPFNTTLDVSWDGEAFTGDDAYRFTEAGTDLTEIKLYTDKNTSHTLAQALETGKSVMVNQFRDHIVNISFHIKKDVIANVSQLYKFEIDAGFKYPLGESSIIYEQKEKMLLINSTYGQEKEIIYSTDWTEEKEMDPDEEYIPIGVGSRNETNYRIHFRTNQKGDNFCSLILLFDPEAYNPEINRATGSPQYNIPVSNEYYDKEFFNENLFKKIHLTKVVDGEATKVDLFDVADFSSNPTYNLFGEEGAIGFRLKADDGNTYNAFTSITVDDGCCFPCYATTNGPAKKYYYYRQFTTIGFTATSPSATEEWSVHFERLFKLGDVTIKSLKAEDITFSVDGGEVTKPFATIEFNENIFESVTKNTDASLYFDQNILHSVFVNGHAVSFLNKDTTTRVLLNTNGEGNTYSISVEGIKSASDITNVIVNNLSSNITMACSDPNVKTVYGECPYYKLTDSASFTKNGAEFSKDSEIVYTVWFDGANPIKVRGKTIGGGILVYRWDTENKPANPTKDHAIFNYWVDETGNKLEEGTPQITGSIDYTSYWTNLYTVKLDLGDKVVTFDDVKEGVRLSSIDAAKQYLNLTKGGYFLDKWVDENGQEYSLDNRIYSNLTLKAVWVELKGETTGGGCGGSVIAVAGVISLITALGAALLIIKKKKHA